MYICIYERKCMSIILNGNRPEMAVNGFLRIDPSWTFTFGVSPESRFGFLTNLGTITRIKIGSIWIVPRLIACDNWTIPYDHMVKWVSPLFLS